MRSRSKGSSPRNMAAISVSISAFVTVPPKVSPRPQSPSSVCIWTINRVQSELAPPHQRIGATKGMLTTVTSILEIFMMARACRLPRRASRHGEGFARQAAGFLAAEKKRKRRDLLGVDQPLLGISFGDHSQIFFYVAPLSALLDPKAGSDSRQPGRDGSRIDGVASHAMSRAFKGDATGKAEQTVLGSAIGAMPGEAHFGRRRTDVDDAAPAALGHRGKAALSGPVGTIQIDV